MQKATSKAMLKEFRSAGHRMTRQRRKVFEYLESSGEQHPSALQIFSELSETDARISVATVYNTLNTLVRLRLVKVLEFDGSDNRYETNMTPHFNLVCRECGAITDYAMAPVHDPVQVENDCAFTVSDARTEYHGICAECRGSSIPEAG